MRQEVKDAIKIFGAGFGMAGWLIMFGTFLKAYKDPEKEVTVEINRYGEAVPELILFSSLSPIVVLGFYYTFKDFLKK